MKGFIIYTIIASIIMAIIGILMSIFSDYGMEAWQAIGCTAFVILAIPWAIYFVFIFSRYAVYEIRKAWIKAEEDAKK